MNRAAVIEQLKATQETLNKLLALLPIQRGRQVLGPSLPSEKAVSPGLRTSQQGQQGDRAPDNCELPGGAEPGLSGRLSRLGTPPTDSRVTRLL